MQASFRVILFCLVVTCFGKKKVIPPNRHELPFVRCPTCEFAVKNIVREAKVIRDSTPPTKQMLKLEEKFIKLAENVCDPEADEGEWITKLDIVADPQSQYKAKLVEQRFFGKCNKECQTIAKSCQSMIEDYDVYLAEMLTKETKRAVIVDKLCYQKAKVCGRKAKKLPKPPSTLGSEKFSELTDKAYEMAKMMRKFKGSGMDMPGMEMFDRDDLTERLGGGDETKDSAQEESEPAKQKPVEPQFLDSVKGFFQSGFDWLTNFFSSSKKPEL